MTDSVVEGRRCTCGIHCCQVWKPMTEPAKHYYTVKAVYEIAPVWGISAKRTKVLRLNTFVLFAEIPLDRCDFIDSFNSIVVFCRLCHGLPNLAAMYTTGTPPALHHTVCHTKSVTFREGNTHPPTHPPTMDFLTVE